MKSRLRITVKAPAARVFAFARDVERWPELLPHYRYVRPQPGAPGERRFAMGARRGPIPVRWEAIQRPLPERGEIEFRHTAGVTRGMRAAWRIEPRGDEVEVSIEHHLDLAWPLIGRFAAERIIGPLFVEPIAGRTLRHMKRITEADR